MFVNIGEEVHLNSFEIEIGEMLGRRRCEAQIKKGVPNEKRSQRSDEEVSILGALGELAFCKLHNIHPDFEIKMDYATNGYDCIYRGKTIDVKTVTQDHHTLLVKPKEMKKQRDLYALMFGLRHRFIFKGYIEAEEVFQECNFKTWPVEFPNYVIHPSKLKRFVDLKFDPHFGDVKLHLC